MCINFIRYGSLKICLWQAYHPVRHLITLRCAIAVHNNKKKSIYARISKAFWLTSLRETLGTGSVVVVMSISPSISDISSENPFGMVVSPLLPFCDWFFGDDFLSSFTCRLCNTKRPITSVKHSSTPTVTDMNKYKKNFSWFSAEKNTEKKRKLL